MIEQFWSCVWRATWCPYKIYVQKQNQLRSTALNNTFLLVLMRTPKIWLVPSTNDKATSFIRIYPPLWLSCCCWSDLGQSVLEQRGFGLHMNSRCAALGVNFPLWLHPTRLLSIAISSTDIPTSSEVTPIYYVVLFGRLHFLSFSFTWTIFVWLWLSDFVLFCLVSVRQIAALAGGF